MGRLLFFAVLGSCWSGAVLWVGIVLGRRQSPTAVLARERRRVMRRLSRASRKGRHGEAELWERQLAVLDEPAS